MISSVLVIGHPEPHRLEMGADHVTDLEAAEHLLHKGSYRVIVLPLSISTAPRVTEWIARRRHVFPNTHFILGAEIGSENKLLDLIQQGGIFHICETLADPNLEQTIRNSSEQASFEQQQQDLVTLVQEQTARLDNLRLELEERVQRRTRSLESSRIKLVETNARVETFHLALLALHQAQSVVEMERRLLNALTPSLNLSALRIVFSAQSSIQTLISTENIYAVLLSLNGEREASVIFHRESTESFTKAETAFLDQVAEAAGLALDRLMALKESENLKKQWDATFDAILDPLCITTLDFKIVRTNKAFCRIAKKSFSEVIGQDPLLLLFAESAPLEPAMAASKFKFQKIRSTSERIETFEVSGATFLPTGAQAPIRWILFHDTTETKLLEKQIVESAKMAELGTIGSSIAHELNNPVGGMLSFLQLIKMDLEPDHPHFADIDEMEKAAIRCKEIIENLLGFARKQSSMDAHVFDLKPLLAQVTKLQEVSRRSEGLKIEMQLPETELKIYGHADQLLKALHNILQNASEAVSERAKTESGFQGLIRLAVKEVKNKTVITITDNGLGIDSKNLKYIFNPLFTTKDPQKNSGLGLTVAFRIIREHGGELEILSRSGEGTTARISLGRPDLALVGRHFDGKI